MSGIVAYAAYYGIWIRLTKSYEEHDFWTCPKKRVALLTPQVFRNSYNWVRKIKTTTEKGIRTILFMYRKSKNTIQKSGLYNFNHCTYSTPYSTITHGLIVTQPSVDRKKAHLCTKGFLSSQLIPTWGVILATIAVFLFTRRIWRYAILRIKPTA